jgi:cysteine desulfurase/selenocysteine lyase
MEAVASHEHEISQALVDVVERTPGVRLIGPAAGEYRAALASFIVDGVHAHDVGQFLDDRGITVRTGHHCAQPLHRALGTASSTRASAGVYSTLDDVAAFGAALAEVRGFFGADR